jgi:hypothetical protein
MLDIFEKKHEKKLNFDSFSAFKAPQVRKKAYKKKTIVLNLNSN